MASDLERLEPHPFERAPIGLECRRCGGGIDNPIHSGESDRPAEDPYSELRDSLGIAGYLGRGEGDR